MWSFICWMPLRILTFYRQRSIEVSSVSEIIFNWRLTIIVFFEMNPKSHPPAVFVSPDMIDIRQNENPKSQEPPRPFPMSTTRMSCLHCFDSMIRKVGVDTLLVQKYYRILTSGEPASRLHLLYYYWDRAGSVGVEAATNPRQVSIPVNKEGCFSLSSLLSCV